MNKHLLIVIAILLLKTSVFAQLSGTKTIGGTNSDYSTISAAVTALNSNGINGAVIFNIANGTYNEQFTIGNISGASVQNTITFQSASNDSSLVTIEYASSTSYTNNYVVKLANSKYISFKNISAKRTGTNDFANVIVSTGTTSNITFENCYFKNGSASSTFNSALIYATNGTSNNHSSYLFNNNRFENGSFGIYFLGVGSTSLSNGNTFTNNIFINQGRGALSVKFLNAPIINKNTIKSTATYSNFAAIETQYCDNGIQIKNNRIAITKKYGIKMDNSSGQIMAGLISNNFISISANSAIGLSYNNSGSHNIYFNSINLTGSSSYGLHINGQSSNNIRFLNNVVKVGTNGKCMNILNANYPFLDCNYNDYYYPSATMGKWGSTVTSDLSSWVSTTNLDYSSINTDPLYTNDTNLYIDGNSGLSKKGTTALTTPSTNIDIDGRTRNTTKPDIGAHEFSVEDLSVVNININDTYCSGETVLVKVELLNSGNTYIDGNIILSYKYGTNNAISETISISMLEADSSEIVTFTTPLAFTTAGNNSLLVRNLYSDSEQSNDSLSKEISVKQSPSLNMANDTTACNTKSLIIDAGAGMDSYLWSTGATTQTIVVDSTGIGVGAKFFSVLVSSNGCYDKDSILVIFKNCVGIEENFVDKSIEIYPNPTTRGIYIKSTDNNLGDAKISIYNNLGQMVITKTISGNYIDLEGLKNGYYYIHIQTNKGVSVKSILMKK
jgi:hypothetical protein